MDRGVLGYRERWRCGEGVGKVGGGRGFDGWGKRVSGRVSGGERGR